MTTPDRVARFPELLVAWAKREGLRSFPWRTETDPYRLLMAELMLRRTRAPNVVATYLRFVERWPTPADFLAAADEEILAVLHPLGLRWRARNFLAVRDHMRSSGGHELDDGYESLLTLPGVGGYVASAIRCFSAGETRPLIDANSVRVICRVFGIPFGPETRRRKPFLELAEQVLSRTEPRIHNLAILDLAATVCIIRDPKCGRCPMQAICDFAGSGKK